MVNCAVLSCKRRSETSNLREHGISYYRFPKDPHLKKQWVKCCGRTDTWCPTTASVICSEHFTPQNFKILSINNRRLLVKSAIPTLKACQCTNFGEINEITNESIASTTKLQPETSRIRKLKTDLRNKNIKIRRLQARNRYLINKVNNLEDLLKDLTTQLLINKEQKLVLEKNGITEKDQLKRQMQKTDTN